MIPAHHVQSAAKTALGKGSFFDPRFSVDNNVACANCHDSDKGFTDQLPASIGVHGKFGQSHAATLEDQAGKPILNPIAIAMEMPDQEIVVAKLNSIPEYPKRFRGVFGAALIYQRPHARSERPRDARDRGLSTRAAHGRSARLGKH